MKRHLHEKDTASNKFRRIEIYLPDDIVCLVLGFLDAASVFITCSLVSKRFHRIANEEVLFDACFHKLDPWKTFLMEKGQLLSHIRSMSINAEESTFDDLHWIKPFEDSDEEAILDLEPLFASMSNLVRLEFTLLYQCDRLIDILPSIKHLAELSLCGCSISMTVFEILSTFSSI